MHDIYIHTKQWQEKAAIVVFIAFLAILAILGSGVANAKGMEHDAALDASVMATLKQCQEVSTSCAGTTKNSAGVLVFPSVVKADLIIGGSGGKGALVENGKVTGYYNIGSGSAGLQAGIETASQIYVFRTAKALSELKASPDWKAGANVGVTLIEADANAKGSTEDVLVYVFDSKGLHAGLSLDVFNIWKAGQDRPRTYGANY